MHLHGLSPLTVVFAEVLVDGGLQLKEVLLHCSPDGSLNYPEEKKQTYISLISFIKEDLYLCVFIVCGK